MVAGGHSLAEIVGENGLGVQAAFRDTRVKVQLLGFSVKVLGTEVGGFSQQMIAGRGEACVKGGGIGFQRGKHRPFAIAYRQRDRRVLKRVANGL